VALIVDRRQFFAGVAAAALAGTPRAFAGSTLNLGAIAAARGLMFGSAFDREVLGDPSYGQLIVDQCMVGAMENSLKFDWLRPKGPEADYAVADQLVDLANARGLAVRGTALIWNDWLPDWLEDFDASEIAATMDRHIDETAGRYAGRVRSWDVVNEPFFPMHGMEGGYRKGLWFEAMGPDYIPRAFRRAQAADPSAQLVLNEAFCEQFDDWGNGIRPLLRDLVVRLKNDGIKLDAVGFQGHLKPYLPFDDAAFAAYLADIAALDVDIMITELDVDDSHLPDDIATRDTAVAARLSQFLGAVLQVPRLTSVIAWHLSDRYSWYRNTDWYGEQVESSGGTNGRAPRSHLFDTDLKPKAAAEAVAETMRRLTRP
jgi:endo-1,4-beta-xylanase